MRRAQSSGSLVVSGRLRRGSHEAARVHGLLGGAAAWPVAARAQQPDRVRLIGVLMTIAADDPQAQTRQTTFRAHLEQLGWTEKRNVQIDTRFGGTDPDRIRKYAAELVELAPDVVLASSTAALAPLLQLTRTVPNHGATDATCAGG
jgi:putative tryptophan/tyrosine transport system substrate-binding protein